ncbi:MAG: RecB family exonuclease [Calditrichaceae bacterium]
MDIAELRKQPHLSVSSINSYIDCSLMYKFSRIDKLKPDFLSDNLVFGSCIHRILAEFNQEKMIGNILSSDEIENMFKTDWEKSAKDNPDIQYSKGNTYRMLLNQGVKMLQEFMKRMPENDATIVAIEEPFAMHIEGLDIPLIGVMDLVEEDEDGTLTITDYKTSKKSMAIKDVDSSFQLTVYYTAAKANGYADREINLKFDCLVKTQKPKFEQIYTERSGDHSAKAIKKIKQVWDGIQKGVFIPNDTSWRCHGCSYKSYCDEWFRK